MFHNFWHAIGGDKARFLPGSFSTFAESLDSLTIYLIVLSSAFTIGILFCMIFFCIRYRRLHSEQLAHDVPVNYKLEIAWTLAPTALILIAFFWGARVYMEMDSPPLEGISIYVFAKQWMWKFEHEDGISEINELHLPIGKNIRLLMISQDVIHSFFIPEFRVKFDVLPERYTRSWFRPIAEGQYHILCSQYCGTDHSRMTGLVSVLSSAAFANWTSRMHASQISILSSVGRGERLFHAKSCIACHDGKNDRAPNLNGIYGSQVHLSDGTYKVADEGYLRRSILRPSADLVFGYADVMPTYAGQISELEINDLISFLRSIGRPNTEDDPK